MNRFFYEGNLVNGRITINQRYVHHMLFAYKSNFNSNSKFKLPPLPAPVLLPPPPAPADGRSMNILHLNEYCVDYIVRFLPIDDVINFAEADKNLKYVCQRRFSYEKELQINFRFLEIEKTRRLLHHIGPYLENLELNVGYSLSNSIALDVFDEIIKSCKKVFNLTINYLAINEEHIKKLKQIVPQLVYLNFGTSVFHADPNEMFLKCKQLQHLELLESYEFTFDGITNIKTLKTLVINIAFGHNRLDLKNLSPSVEVTYIP